MMDYLARVCASPLSSLPWQPLDSMLMANVCYNKLGALAATHEGMPLDELAQKVDLSPFSYLPFFTERKALLMAMGDSVRFGAARACCYLDVRDNTRPMQFSAVTMLVPGLGVVVCFRGTDNTITGWREDLHMSFETVPAQEAAAVYLMEIARRYPGPLYIVGHSKGGNLGAYAAVHASLSVQARIERIDCFDSPGLDAETLKSEGYAMVRSLINLYVPQDSVIGMLMDTDSRTRMTVVKSTAPGLRQHDCFSWQVDGEQLVTLPDTTFGSKLTDRTLDAWMEKCTPEQRRKCVDALFDLLDATQADTLAEMKSNMGQSMQRILAAARELDGETMLTFLQMAGLLIQSGAATAADMVFVEQAAAQVKQLTSRLPVDQLKGLINSLSGEQLKNLLTNLSLDQLKQQLSAGATFDQLKQRTQNIFPEAKVTLDNTVNGAEQLVHKLGVFAQTLKKNLQDLEHKADTNRSEDPDEGGMPQ